ncbi:MAG TPA: hypothetical protein VGN41_17280 [Streptosporangiaceae bacterium]
MIASLAAVLAAALAMAGVIALALAGFRDGDRPDDATVTAVLKSVPHPDGPQRIVIATVRNPGAVPVLAGLSARRSRVPGWLGAGLSVTVPRRTRRRRYGPQAQATVGVVGPGDSAHWAVPVPGAGRRCDLIAVIGQSGGRLRVIRLPVATHAPGMAAARGGAGTGSRPWLGDGRAR